MANLAYRYEDERPTEMIDGVIYMMATPIISGLVFLHQIWLTTSKLF